MEITRRHVFLNIRTIPSVPAKGPHSTRTRSPTCRNGHGSQEFPDFKTARIALSSPSSTGMRFFPKPTIAFTPGMVRTGRRWRGLNLQKTYPGKRGTSISLMRSDQRLERRYKGRNSSYPLPRRLCATTFSKRIRTQRAYQSELSTWGPGGSKACIVQSSVPCSINFVFVAEYDVDLTNNLLKTRDDIVKVGLRKLNQTRMMQD